MNAYSGPIMVMVVTGLMSFVFIPIHFLTMGSSLSLFLYHEEPFQSVLVSSIAVWTGFWIGTSLNVNFLKYLVRDVTEKMLQSYTLTNCIDQVFFKHGIKIMILLRLSPFFRLNILI